ncbi:MAG TPA: TonB-dependent receptor [Thermoanaerobaculia bacterium]|nr:TonB-dependent receptor [Thermoanaerobaculia bacterium]
MTRKRILGLLALLLVVVVGATSAMGQSTTTGNLTGKVENENAGLPGVTVTIKSPNLQGTRTATTSAAGAFTFAALPPGEYTVSFALQGFQSITKTVKVTAGQQSALDVNMTLSGVQASAVVTAKSDIVSTTTQASTTITNDLSNTLPNTRTIAQAAALSSGVTPVVSLGNALTIGGAPTFDNLYTVDGAVITDNIRATPNNLFVEDAIQETTTNVNGISAEYGRFQGGVINTVTKSGGNTFSGSFRTTFVNDAWSAVTPQGETRVQDLQERYEATLGGPIWKDHIWFFGSGRSAKVGTAQTTFADAKVGGATPVGGYAGIPYTNTLDEQRYSGKLTLTPIQNHTLTASYLSISNKEGNNVFGVVLDEKSFVQRELPQDTLSIAYNGVFTSNLFFEGMYSNRHFTFKNSGSTFTDVINGTLMRDRSRGNARWNSPTFCGVCGPEKRDNEDVLLKATYFLSTGSLGSHNIVLGYDTFKGIRTSNNYQSGSNYRIFHTSTINYNGTIYPVINNVGTSSFIYYTPIFQLTQGTSTKTDSFFLNDQWRLNDRLSFNLGVRYDKNNAKNSVGATTANDSAWSPRLAVNWDVTGKGNVRLGASYAHYVGGLQDSIQDSTSAGGQPATFYWYYNGAGTAPINVGVPAGTQPPVSAAQAIQQVFNWFYAQGCPDLATCKLPLAYGSIPGLNRAIDGTVKSPYAREYTIGIAGNIGSSFSYRADVVRREFHDFYNLVVNTQTGYVTTPTGAKLDFGLIGNTNSVERNYTGLQTQFQYRWQWLTIGGNWTWSHTLGNFDAEAGNSGAVTNATEAYPEYKQMSWNAPYGSMAADQRHRVRLLASADLPFIPKSLGNFNLGLIQGYDTGSPYGAVGTVRASNYVTNPGYQQRPSTSTYYYTARDEFRTDDIKRTDLSLTWTLRLFNTLELFVQPQVLNVTNNQGAIAVNQTVQTLNNTTGYLHFNPFTTTPVRGERNVANPTANWNYGPSFGQVTSVAGWQQPRTFLLTAGLRF